VLHLCSSLSANDEENVSLLVPFRCLRFIWKVSRPPGLYSAEEVIPVFGSSSSFFFCRAENCTFFVVFLVVPPMRLDNSGRAAGLLFPRAFRTKPFRAFISRPSFLLFISLTGVLGDIDELCQSGHLAFADDMSSADVGFSLLLDPFLSPAIGVKPLSP